MHDKSSKYYACTWLLMVLMLSSLSIVLIYSLAGYSIYYALIIFGGLAALWIERYLNDYLVEVPVGYLGALVGNSKKGKVVQKVFNPGRYICVPWKTISLYFLEGRIVTSFSYVWKYSSRLPQVSVSKDILSVATSQLVAHYKMDILCINTLVNDYPGGIGSNDLSAEVSNIFLSYMKSEDTESRELSNQMKSLVDQMQNVVLNFDNITYGAPELHVSLSNRINLIPRFPSLQEYFFHGIMEGTYSVESPSFVLDKVGFITPGFE